MADSAREYTDAELKAMEDYLTGIYAQAEKDLQKKFEKYLADFARLEMQNQKKVDAGEMSQEEFDEWRKNKLLYGTHWTKLIKQVQNEMSQCNQTALDYVNGKVPQIFAVNYNQLAEVIDNSPVGGYTFELVNADTIKNLATGNEIILPPRKNMDIPKDQLWNAKLVNAQLMQGILQGESIPKMAARMANVCNSNLKAATRTARTMTTAAENSGRQSSINRATADGIILIKEWLATNDERTRDSHVAVNHERVRCDASTEKTKLFSNGLAFPADWHGKPSEVYNCRCTLITKYAGVDSKLLKAAIKRQDHIEKATQKQDKNPQEQAQTATSKIIGKILESHTSTDDNYNKMMEVIAANTIKFRDIEILDKPLSTDEIIALLSGGDNTRGSCASVALAYIGQKLGLNVLDFRDGDSRQVFARGKHLNYIANLDGVVTLRGKGKTYITYAKSLLKQVEKGKEYYLAAGRHASIVRMNDDGVLQYLELQSATRSGWRDFSDDPTETLRNRFGCKKTSSEFLDWVGAQDFMIDIEASEFNDDFKHLLGYINTASDKQRKGTNGTIK